MGRPLSLVLISTYLSGHLCSLGDVLGLSARTEVRSLAPLVIGVNILNSLDVLIFLHSSADDLLLGAFHLVDLWSLVSDLTVTSHGTVNFSYTLISGVLLTYPS